MTKSRESRRRYYEANRERIIAKASAYQKAHPAMAREARRRWQEANQFARHTMQPEDWAEMFTAQDGLCYLCGDPLSHKRRETHIDHDHACCPTAKSCRYCRRGLACSPCNTLIGMASDDPERLRRVADNLEVALAATRQRIAIRPLQETLVEAVAGDMNATWQQAAEALAEREDGDE